MKMAVSGATSKLIGRQRELSVVDRLLDELGAGSSGVIYLVGEPGIGKTALIAESTALAGARSYKTLSGRAAQFERDLPLGVFADAFEQELSPLDSEMVGELGDQVRSPAAAFPSLGPPAESSESTPDQRQHLLREGRALLDELGRERPFVLALDDVHWADPASIDLLCHVLHRPLDHAVLLLLAARPHVAPARLVSALEESERRGSSERLELAPLSEADAYALLGEDVDQSLRERLYQESGGNPFYLEQLRSAARRGAHDDRGLDGPQSDEAVPRAVIAAIAGEVEGLSEPARLLLCGAAVAGEVIEPDLAGETAGVAEGDALSALDELLSTDLIRPTDLPRRFRFRHPIVRRAVYESAGGGWTLAAHARAANALSRRGASASARAHHVERSASAGDAEAVALLDVAGEETAARAPASAAHWFDAALRLLPQTHENSQRRLELLIKRAAALGVAGHVEPARDALRELLKLLPPEPTELRRGAVVLLEVLEDVLGNYDECRQMLLREFSSFSAQDRGAVTEVSTSLAINSFFRTDWVGMRDWARRALEAEPPGALGRAVALSSLALGEYGLGDLHRAERAIVEAAALFDEAADAELAEHGPGIAIWLGWAENCMERLDEAIDHLDRAVSVARSTGKRHLTPAMLAFQTDPLLTRGRLLKASDNADAVMEAALLMEDDSYRGPAMLLRCAVELLRGDLYAAVRFGEQAVGGPEKGDPGSLIARFVLGEALLEIGEPERCREQLISADGVSRIPPIAVFESRCYGLLTRAELARGAVESAEAFAERAAGVAKRFPQMGPRGIAHHAKAAVLLARGDAAGAAGEAIDAATCADRLGAPVNSAFARTLAGEALASAGDRSEAIGALELARAQFAEIGALRYQDRAAQLLRKLGQAVPRRDGLRQDGAMSGLSKRELEVLELVASGRTNREVAAELYLSVRTVDRHVSRIFQKLGVSSRAAAASVFERARSGTR
jgi:DNA-binding CsgD family transcriptional regulator